MVLASAARRGELLQVGGRPQIGAGAGRAWRAVRVQNVVIDLGAVAFVGIGVVAGYWWAVSWLADAHGLGSARACVGLDLAGDRRARPRQMAVSSLSYSTGSRSKAEAGRASAETIGTGVCERPRRGGSGVGRGWTNGRQDRSAAVGQAPKPVSSTLNQPHRGFRPTDGATKTWSGRIVSAFLRPGAARRRQPAVPSRRHRRFCLKPVAAVHNSPSNWR